MPHNIDAETLGGLLFDIHTHANGHIVYKEADIILLLTKLGYPTPVFGKRVSLEAFNPNVSLEPLPETKRRKPFKRM